MGDGADAEGMTFEAWLVEMQATKLDAESRRRAMVLHETWADDVEQLCWALVAAWTQPRHDADRVEADEALLRRCWKELGRPIADPIAQDLYYALEARLGGSDD